MKPLFVLLAAFLISLLLVRYISGTYDYRLPARIAMSVMLMFTAAGHFAFTKGMAMMVPDFIPFKITIVYLTGIFEIIAAIGLLIPNSNVWTARALIVFFVVMLPANINAAIRKVDYQKGTLNGNGAKYLWFRIPLQIVFIVWACFSSIKT